MKQAHVVIAGTVQGVGFRYFIRSWAKTFGVSGWVRNTQDGRVEAVLQGKKEKIEELIENCRQGPFLAEVKSVDVEWEKSVEEFWDFQVK